MNNTIKNIYLDMDGVIVDFRKGYEDLTGIDIGKTFLNGKEFWEPIDKAGIKFWSELDWIEDGKPLYAILYQSKYNLNILSSPSYHASSIFGKKEWVKKHIPDTNLILEYAKNKHIYANEYSILIDDREPNIEDWIKAGGKAILHTSTKETLKQLKEWGVI